MDEATFWDLIASIDTTALGRGDDDTALESLRARLAELEPAAIHGFQERLAQALYDLDGPAYAAHAGGDDEEFIAARCHVVARGRAWHQAVVADPEQMAQTRERHCEALLHIAPEAWAERTDRDPADYDHVTAVSYETGANRARWR